MNLMDMVGKLGGLGSLLSSRKAWTVGAAEYIVYNSKMDDKWTALLTVANAAVLALSIAIEDALKSKAAKKTGK